MWRLQGGAGRGGEGEVKPWEKVAPLGPGWARLPAALMDTLAPPGDSASDGGVLGVLRPWVTR